MCPELCTKEIKSMRLYTRIRLRVVPVRPQFFQARELAARKVQPVKPTRWSTAVGSLRLHYARFIEVCQ